MPVSPHHRDEGVRREAVRRLMFLEQRNSLHTDHIRTVAEAFDVNPRTVNRWLDNARAHGHYTPHQRSSFTLTQPMRDAVARSCGNIAAAHRELAEDGHLGSKPISYATFYRAVTEHYSPGFLAGLRGGERARRAFDIHFNRPPGHRNEAWEADHVEASVWVNVAGHRRKPWITWFVDCATDVICGLCISAQFPSRENVLIAARAALQRGGDFGPFGGVPTLVRVDGGKDFLCQSVEAALGVFGVRRIDLPPDSPWLKGTVEAVNRAIKTMRFPSLPGYTEAPRTSRRTRIDPDEHLLTYEAFVRIVTEWVHDWNHKHVLAGRQRTPSQLWHDDLTPIYDVDPTELHTYTLEPLKRPLTINDDGVHWDKRHYVAPFMQGRKGEKVLLRYMPHHYRQVELYKAKDGTYLGPAILQNAATDEDRRETRRVAERDASRLRTALKRAERQRQERFEADTVPTHPRPVADLTTEQAAHLLDGRRDEERAREARPDLAPLPEPSASWEPSADAQTPLDPTPTSDAPTDVPLPPLPAPSPSWLQTDPNPSTPEKAPDDHD
ncbi:putative transposase [Streptomyces canus]|uniref:Transposase n=1 Tax=Streptomyces canus TaxID=58343 RepID=A0AAW8F3H7_9ACTN|nr:Mu transposase C-terminal domain-containing protein [Streptomyces canus]MDQ0904377.1 putative transposase [Streptomyces canus]